MATKSDRGRSRASGDVRERLLDGALMALEQGGIEALRARELTAQAGVSTMAVYTHFGGMPGLADEIVLEGLRRFAAAIRASAPETDDPLRDLVRGGVAYVTFALGNPQLYRLMFGLSDSVRIRGYETEGEGARSTWTMAEGIDAFSILRRSVERVIAAGIFREQDVTGAATQILVATHGYVVLLLGGFIGDAVDSAPEIALPLNVNLMEGLGADRELVERVLASELGRARP